MASKMADIESEENAEITEGNIPNITMSLTLPNHPRSGIESNVKNCVNASAELGSIIKQEKEEDNIDFMEILDEVQKSIGKHACVRSPADTSNHNATSTMQGRVDDGEPQSEKCASVLFAATSLEEYDLVNPPLKCEMCKSFSCSCHQNDVDLKDCDKSLSSPSCISIHQRIHTGEKPYMCQVCGKKFSSRTGLKVHKARHSGIRPHKCNVCDKSFFTASSLSRHEQTHAGVKPYACSECGRRFSQACHRRIHERTHSGFKPYQCGDCNKCFTCSGELTKHKRNMHSAEKRNAFEECPTTSTYHQPPKQTQSVERNHECGQCGKRFSAPSRLKAHEARHSGIKPFSCILCEKSFLTSSHLSRHQKAHSGVKPYACSECDRCFTQACHLRIHERIHSGIKPYQCGDCNKCFTCSGELTKHKRTVHSAEKRNTVRQAKTKRKQSVEKIHKCGQCGKCFSAPNGLKAHEGRHLGIKPFQCKLCEKTFLTSTRLSRHENMHSGVKPYACSECGRGFAQACHLKRHERIHSGIKPYQCKDCNKCFTSSDNLTKHKLAAHSAGKTIAFEEVQARLPNSIQVSEDKLEEKGTNVGTVGNV